VAAWRAELERPHSPEGDADAQRRLCQGMPLIRQRELQAHLAARTRFFDERVLEAIEGGTQQVVVVGAGYDDRALRFRAPGVRFFEVDQGATQADKRARLGSIGAQTDGLTLVQADLQRDDLAAALAAGGHDAGRPSLFLCEGLLVYLDEPTTVRVLASLATAAHAGSTLAASLAVHADTPPSAAVVAYANSRRRAAASEPWRTILPAAAYLDLLARSGWRAISTVDDSDLDPGAPAGRSLLVTARPA
jgi:methyltransferase (TIGR00027 family)